MAKIKPTLAEVAEAAGVSSATVSRVIRGTGPVSNDIRARIEAAIASLGYIPRKASNGEAGEDTVALLVGDMVNPYFPEVVRGIQEEVDSYGMFLSLYHLTDHPQRQQLLVQRLSHQDLAGVIVIGSSPFPALVEWQQKQQVPLVLLNRRLNLPMVHCILVDFENALYRATQHLLNLKHERIAYLNAFATNEIAITRRRGIEAALNEAGLSLRPEYIVSVPPGTEIDGGYQSMMALLQRTVNDRPTAVLAFNDVIALGALHATRVCGVRVPQDMSMIGVDDVFSSLYACPPLTTMGQPKFRMGALAVQRLRLMREHDLSSHETCTILESPLIVRESTGPAPEK
jgi:LacI family transcriptional regulator